MTSKCKSGPIMDDISRYCAILPFSDKPVKPEPNDEKPNPPERHITKEILQYRIDCCNKMCLDNKECSDTCLENTKSCIEPDPAWDNKQLPSYVKCSRPLYERDDWDLPMFEPPTECAQDHWTLKFYNQVAKHYGAGWLSFGEATTKEILCTLNLLAQKYPNPKDLPKGLDDVFTNNILQYCKDSIKIDPGVPKFQEVPQFPQPPKNQNDPPKNDPPKNDPPKNQHPTNKILFGVGVGIGIICIMCAIAIIIKQLRKT